MGIAQVTKTIAEIGGWVTAKQVIEKLPDINEKNIYRALTKMCMHKEVQVRMAHHKRPATGYILVAEYRVKKES